MNGMTWNGAAPPALRGPRPAEAVRAVLRGTTLFVVTYFGIVFVLIFNLIERLVPLGVAHRITCLWGRICLWVCGVRLNRVGTPMKTGGAVVANHAGWIDIFTLLAADRVYFVAKSEVSGWPLIGWLSRQIGTVYIDRRRVSAKRQQERLHERLARGDRLCVFPEGTSTDGRRVLPFRTTLFSVFMTPELKPDLRVQPVSLVYHAPDGLPEEFYGWWGGMGLGRHLWHVFAMSSGGVVEVIHHPPLDAADFADRKELAAACEARVRDGVERGLDQRRQPAGG